jgi:hypothetical protein
LVERLVLKRHFVAYTSTDEEGFQFFITLI